MHYYDILYTVWPHPWDKKCHAEHQTLSLLWGGNETNLQVALLRCPRRVLC